MKKGFGDLDAKEAREQESLAEKIKRRIKTKGEKKMRSEENKKCAHVPCECDVKPGQKYCGQACENAGEKDVEIACECGHPACPVSV